MAKKTTNKTAHVLQLLTDRSSPDLPAADVPPAETAPAAGDAATTVEAGPAANPTPEPAASVEEKPRSSRLIPPVLQQKPLAPEPEYANLAEVTIRERMDQVLKRMNICSCATCQKFIMTFTLNQTEAFYVDVEAKEEYAAAKEEYQAAHSKEITNLMMRAVFQLKTHPLH